MAYLGHGVGVGSVHHLGGSRAEGGVGSHDLGDIGGVAKGTRTGHKGSGGSDDG